MSSIDLERAARSGLQSIEGMAKHSAKGIADYQPVSKLRQANRWLFFTSPVMLGAILLAVATVYRQLVFDSEDSMDSWGVLDVISILIITYLVRRMLI